MKPNLYKYASLSVHYHILSMPNLTQRYSTVLYNFFQRSDENFEGRKLAYPPVVLMFVRAMTGGLVKGQARQVSLCKHPFVSYIFKQSQAWSCQPEL